MHAAAVVGFKLHTKGISLGVVEALFLSISVFSVLDLYDAFFQNRNTVKSLFG